MTAMDGLGATFTAYGPDDHHDEAAIRAEVTPDAPRTVESLRHDDATWDGAAHWRARAIARDDATGRPVALVKLAHMPWLFHPDRYLAEVLVVPDARGRGIGRAAVAWVDDLARARHAASVRVNVPESDDRSGAFATACGYVERQRSWESRLAVSPVAAHSLPTHSDGARPRDVPGIIIRTLADLRAMAPDAAAIGAIDTAFHALDTEATADLPGLDPPTPVSYAIWAADVIEGPDALPDATFLALDPARGGLMVGTSVLARTSGVPGSLSQGLTAVLREYRGRGIAWALKARTVAYARAHGYREIRTWNNSRNAPMLHINEAMGFVRQPARRTLVKDYRNPAPEAMP